MRRPSLRPLTPLGLALAVLSLCCPCPAQTAAASSSAQPRHTQDVAVRGSVNKPGRLSLPAKTTAWAALQAAGGPLPNADTGQIVIKHLGETEARPFDYALAKQHPDDPKADPLLMDGDTVIVPALAPDSAFTVSGPGIRSPAEYALPTPTVSLATALGKAGGLEDRAEIDKVRITRTGPGGHVTVIVLNAASPAVQAAFQVQPGDDIVIGQSKRKSKVDFPAFRPTSQGPDGPHQQDAAPTTGR